MSKADSAHSGGDVVTVGRIHGGYGVKGWVRLSAFTDPVSNIVKYQPWLLATPESASTAAPALDSPRDWRSIEVLAVKAHKEGFVAQLTGVNDRDAADRLKGALIGVPVERLPEPQADEYYWRDLLGMQVWDQHGVCLGTVANLLETGANDVLVIHSSDPARDETLIPFHRRFVSGVDHARRRIDVDWDGE